jgi:hypothetical protein
LQKHNIVATIVMVFVIMRLMFDIMHRLFDTIIDNIAIETTTLRGLRVWSV